MSKFRVNFFFHMALIRFRSTVQKTYTSTIDSWSCCDHIAYSEDSCDLLINISQISFTSTGVIVWCIFDRCKTAGCGKLVDNHHNHPPPDHPPPNPTPQIPTPIPATPTSPQTPKRHPPTHHHHHQTTTPSYAENFKRINISSCTAYCQ